jgi:Flp pilus assembly pilin Flp
MKRMVDYVRSLYYGAEGQDLLEYALLVALIAIAAVGAVSAAGGKVSAVFNSITSKITVP